MLKLLEDVKKLLFWQNITNAEWHVCRLGQTMAVATCKPKRDVMCYNYSNISCLLSNNSNAHWLDFDRSLLYTEMQHCFDANKTETHVMNINYVSAFVFKSLHIWTSI